MRIGAVPSCGSSSMIIKGALSRAQLPHAALYHILHTDSQRQIRHSLMEGSPRGAIQRVVCIQYPYVIVYTVNLQDSWASGRRSQQSKSPVRSLTLT